MQTFLPYDDFYKSLNCLDNKRLGKQRVETYQILNALAKGSGAWYNHPATQMWKGYEDALKHYFNISVDIWESRGFANTMTKYKVKKKIKYPKWFGWKAFHDSHKSNLLRKDYYHYNQFFPDMTPDQPYIWPTDYTWK